MPETTHQSSLEHEAAWQREAVIKEAKIMEGSAPDTFRGFDVLDKRFAYFGISSREIVKGKVVGDMGSGLGGLAKSVAAEELPATIWSINPHLAQPDFKLVETEATLVSLPHLYPGMSAAQIAAAQEYHDRYLSTAFAHNLDFPDNTFDALIDFVAASAYMHEGEEALYERSVREMMRVLKPGGKLYIADGFKASIGAIDEETGQPMFKEQIVQELGIQYQPIMRAPNKSIGAVLRKQSE